MACCRTIVSKMRVRCLLKFIALGCNLLCAEAAKGGSTTDKATDKTKDPPQSAMGCEDDWNKLLTLDINGKVVSDRIKYPKKISIEVDPGGYVLAKPAKAVVNPEFGYNKQSENQLSFWTFFKCNKDTGKMVHDHCRIGDANGKWQLKLPVSKYWNYDDDDKSLRAAKVSNDDINYICRESNSDAMNADLSPWRGSNPLKPKAGENSCKRMDGSNWCGVPAEIESNGCQDEWNLLQKGKEVDRKGMIRMINIDTNVYSASTRSLVLKITCKDQKLLVQQCSANYDSFTIDPGCYLRQKGFVWTCPGAEAGTAAQIAELTVVKSATSGVPKDIPKGLKLQLPSEIDRRCEKDWQKLTKGGDRDNDGPYVKIVQGRDTAAETGVDPRNSFVVPALWALFKCPTTDSANLAFDHCRVGRKEKLPANSYHVKQDEDDSGKKDFFFNCGDGSGKAITVANVGAMLTQTAKKVEGLKVEPTLTKI